MDLYFKDTTNGKQPKNHMSESLNNKSQLSVTSNFQKQEMFQDSKLNILFLQIFLKLLSSRPN